MQTVNEEEEEYRGGKEDTMPLPVRNLKAIVLPCLHGVLAIVLTGLMATLYTDKKVSIEGWVTSPTRCTLWVDGACVPKSDPLALDGKIKEYESRSTGLFSAIHAPFLCLSMQVLSLALTLKWASTQSEMHATLKHMSLAVIGVFGALYLFMQPTWDLPMNNVLLVECIYLLSLFFVGSAPKQCSGDSVWLVNVVLTYPLLSVAALAAAGVNDTSAHVAVFFSLVLACLALLAAVESDSGDVSQLLVTFWLCLLPCVVQCSLRLRWSLASWAVAALALTLTFYIVMAVLVTITLEWLAGLLPLEPPTLLMREEGALEYLDFGVKSVISIVIMLGMSLS